MNVEHAIALAYRQFGAGQPEPARELCREALDLAPGNAGALHLLGLIAHAAGNIDEAVDNLNQACRMPGVPAVYFCNLAEMQRQRRRFAEAEAAARAATTRDPNFSQGWSLLGAVLQEAGKLNESLVSLERARALDPGNPEILTNLGNCMARLGRLEAACAAFAAVLTQQPDHGPAHANLAAALHARGHHDKALSHAERAIALDPQLVTAYVTAATVLHLRGASASALLYLDHLLAIEPTHLRGLLLQARIFEGALRHDEALAVTRRAAELYPDDGPTLLALGKALQTRGDLPAARIAVQRAAPLLAEPAEAYAVEAALLVESGDLAGAFNASQAALRHNPRYATAWLGHSDIKRFRRDDPEIRAMQDLLGPDGVQGAGEKIALHFALGKAFMDHGDSDSAFQHFRAGNRLKRADLQFEIGQTIASIESIAAKFSAERMNRLRGAGAPGEQPVFIIGMPRSGTTLAEQILASHPEVHGAGELFSITAIAKALVAETSRPYPDLAATLGAAQLRRMGERHIAHLRRHSDKARVVDKMPANFLHAGLMHLILPQARIIHVRRDPADTCLSCYTKLFDGAQSFTYDLTELGRFYGAYRKLMAHWRNVLPAEQFIEIDYEDVVADLPAQARRLIAFCGLEWNEACLRFYETKRPVRTASATQVRTPLYTSSIGKAERYRGFLEPLFSALET